MKNDGTLPLNGTEKIHIAGKLFENMRYQGAGSSLINPSMLTTPKDAFDQRGIKSVSLEESDIILVFAGLTDQDESESCDREHMRLPEDQINMISTLCDSGKKVVIVLFGGSQVTLAWAKALGPPQAGSIFPAISFMISIVISGNLCIIILYKNICFKMEYR